MARWEPNARERLEQAAIELFREHGYAQTTVQEIAARASLTERTFFRYFTDKREVLFSGTQALRAKMLEGVAQAPRGLLPLDVAVFALEAAALALQQQRDIAYVRVRQALLNAHPELQERELIKLASLASELGDALRQRGVAPSAASLAAEAGIALFKIGFERWVSGAEPNDFAKHIHAAQRELRVISGAARSAP